MSPSRQAYSESADEKARPRHLLRTSDHAGRGSSAQMLVFPFTVVAVGTVPVWLLALPRPLGTGGEKYTSSRGPDGKGSRRSSNQRAAPAQTRPAAGKRQKGNNSKALPCQNSEEQGRFPRKASVEARSLRPARSKRPAASRSSPWRRGPRRATPQSATKGEHKGRLPPRGRGAAEKSRFPLAAAAKVSERGTTRKRGPRESSAAHLLSSWPGPHCLRRSGAQRRRRVIAQCRHDLALGRGKGWRALLPRWPHHDQEEALRHAGGRPTSLSTDDFGATSEREPAFDPPTSRQRSPAAGLQ